MENDFIKVVEAIKKLQRKELKDSELEELKNYLPDSNLEMILQNCKDSHYLLGKFKEYEGYSSSEAYRLFLREVKKRRRKNRYFWRGVAAAFLLLLSGTLFLYTSQEEVKPLAIGVTDHSPLIEPGSRKAILKLGDGSVVDVTGDSMQIQDKNGMKIEYADGKISYRSQEKITKWVYNELVVPVAGECFIVLEDRTKVWINSDSKLKYPVKFIGDERKVFLEGEAYFEVTKDGKPFIVSTPRGEIVVAGTAFDVKVYAEDAEMFTTLVSGKVNFRDSTGDIALLPGEQVVVDRAGKTRKRTVNVEEYVGWQSGLYVFRDQSLEKIMTDLARWYDVAVFYQNPEMKKIRFTGNLQRYEHINVFMDILSRTGDVKYNIDGNTIILYR